MMMSYVCNQMFSLLSSILKICVHRPCSNSCIILLCKRLGTIIERIPFSSCPSSLLAIIGRILIIDFGGHIIFNLKSLVQ
jgi:hypothetical protein